MKDYETFPPLEIVGANGPYLELADGRKIIDAISSWWCKSVGHRHPAIIEAVRRQYEQFGHVILANTTHDAILRLSERLVNFANGYPADDWGQSFQSDKKPGHFSKVFYADNGSCAVEVTLKMAIQAQAQRGLPQRTRFTAFENGYHGETAGALSVSNVSLYQSPYRPLMFDCDFIRELPLRHGKDDPDFDDASGVWPRIEAQLEPLADSLAAIIYEPVLQGAGGMRIYSPDLIRRLRRWADAHSVYLIADEIAAGMGRLGLPLAGHWARSRKPNEEEQLVQPDFALLSKGLTGGELPMAVVLMTDEIYDCFYSDYADLRGFLHSHTFSGNALAVAAANATFDIFDSENVFENIRLVGGAMIDRVRRLEQKLPFLANARGLGMVAAVDIVGPDGRPLDWKRRTGYRVYREAVSLGALLRPLGDTMYVFPPLNATDDIIVRIIEILEQSLVNIMSRG
jgi:adenosylmethionine-8-amino-7-oxononanoate aminotransferase